MLDSDGDDNGDGDDSDDGGDNGDGDDWKWWVDASPRVILRGTDNKSCLHSPPISLSPLFLSLEIEKWYKSFHSPFISLSY